VIISPTRVVPGGEGSRRHSAAEPFDADGDILPVSADDR
jgi:hypothetical protein